MSLLPGLPESTLGIVAVLISIWVFGMLGGVAHELTHYVLARLLGAEATWSLSSVEYRFDSAPVLYLRIVNLAPIVIGLVGGAVAYWQFGPFRWALLWYYGLVFWIAYTLMGFNPEDLSIAASAGKKSALHKPQALAAVIGAGMYAIGLLIGRPQTPLDFPWGPTLQGTGLTIVIIGIFVAELQFWREGRIEEMWAYQLQQYHERQMEEIRAQRDES